MERIYTIPLRREYLKVPRWKRAKKAMKAIREFTVKHMKVEADNVKISNSVNEVIWERGGKKVPPKITVKMIKEEEVVYVLLPDEELKKKEEKKEKKKVKKEEKPPVEKVEEVKENGRESNSPSGEQKG